MFGWRGKVLVVDLSTRRIRENILDPQIAKEYIGGRGLGIYYLNQLADPNCDPLLLKTC